MSLTSTSRVLIVGGTSGIGLAVARAAAERGAQVVLGSRSAGSRTQALSLLPASVTGFTVDVTSPESQQAFFEQAGPFDHLVYTAGDELLRLPIGQYTAEQGQHFFDIRFFRALETVRAALPTLNPNGSITLTSGAAAYGGGKGMLLGATVSAATISAGRSLAIELAPVRVNVVAPGPVRTPLWGLPEDDEFFAYADSQTLLGHLAHVEDVAKAYLHLMDQNSVTGTTTLVDAGSLLT